MFKDYKIPIAFLILVLVIIFCVAIQAQNYPISRDIECYQGDYTVLSFEIAGDVSSDSLVFGVKADRLNATPRVIERRNTAGGGDDTEIQVIYGSKSTILVKLLTADTDGLTPAMYVYDLTKDSTTIFTGYFKIRDDVLGTADGVATKTPYYTVALDTPSANNVFPVGMDSNNVWYQKNVAQVRSILGVDTSGGTSASLDSLYTKTSHIVKLEEFGGVGDGVTDNSIAFSNAIASFDTNGGTIILDAKTYVINNAAITINRGCPITIQGQGWNTLVQDFYGNYQWSQPNAIKGTVIKVTGAHNGIETDFVSQRRLIVKDLAILGTGVGTTSIGINMGEDSGTQNQNQNILDNVFIANFSTGLNLTQTLDNTFYDLFIWGCIKGLVVDVVADINFYRTDIEVCDTAIYAKGGNLVNFFGGLIQANNTGILIYPTANAMENWWFNGFWFEHNNYVGIEINTALNPISGVGFQNCRSSDSLSFKPINSIARLSLINCQFSSRLDLSGLTNPVLIGGWFQGDTDPIAIIDFENAIQPVILNTSGATYIYADSLRVGGRTYLDTVSAINNSIVLEDKLKLLNSLDMQGDVDIDSIKIDSDDSVRVYITGRSGEFLTLGKPHDHRVFSGELSDNVTFDDSTGCDFGIGETSWTISGGVLSNDGSGVYGESVGVSGGEAGKLYKIEYDLTVTQGFIGVKMGSGGSYTFRTLSGHYKEYQTSVSNGLVTIAAFIDSSDTSAFIGTLDNLSLMEVLSEDSVIAGRPHISPITFLNPTVDDTLFLGKWDKRTGYDSLAVFDIQDSVAIQVFYRDTLDHNLITTVDTLITDGTIIFDVTDIPIDAKLYLYFVYIGDSEAYIRSQIYWRD